MSLPAPVSPYSKENSGTRPGARLRIQAEVGKCLCQRPKFLCWAEASAALAAVMSCIGVSSRSRQRDYSAGVCGVSCAWPCAAAGLKMTERKFVEGQPGSALVDEIARPALL